MFIKDSLEAKLQDRRATATIQKFSELEPKFQELVKDKTETVLVIRNSGQVKKVLPIKNDSLGDTLEAMFL